MTQLQTPVRPVASPTNRPITRSHTGPAVRSVSHWEDERSDVELLRAHSSGDRYAFDTLIRRHQDRLWGVALRTMRNADDAADALQDALVSAFRAAGSFRAESAVTTWLHRIVTNACLDLIRRRKARPATSFPGTGPGEPADPHDAIAERDTTMTVHDALTALPTRQRAAITLVDLHGYSIADTANILGVPEGTIKSRCARGRARLAAVLTGRPDADE